MQVICHDIENKKFEVDSSELIFRPAAYGVVIENNKVLLSKKWDGYDFPGGAVEIDETIDEALEREYFEESGVKIKKIAIIDCVSDFFFLPFSKKPVNSIMMYFLCKRVAGKLSTENLSEDEKKYVGEPEWVDVDRIGKIKFYDPSDVEEIIRKAVKMMK